MYDREETIHTQRDGRQFVSLDTVRRLREHYIHAAPHFRLPERRIQEQAGAQPLVTTKACGVHNEIDLIHCLNAGINTIGIHLFAHDRQKYVAELRELGFPLPLLEMAAAVTVDPDQDLPMPWAETEGIRSMLRRISKESSPVTTVLVMKPGDAVEPVRMFRKLIPADFNHPLVMQWSSAYNPALLNDVTHALEESQLQQVRHMQSLSLEQADSATIEAVNNDPNVDFVLLDSSRGRGVVTSHDALLSVAGALAKPFFIAGGLTADNVGGTVSSLRASGVRPFGVDVQTGIRHPKQEQIFGIQTQDAMPEIVIRQRVNPLKTEAFMARVLRQSQQE